MKLEAAETATPVLGARLVTIPHLAVAATARLCDDLPGLAVLAALFLLPLAFNPYAEAGFSITKAALLQSLAVVAVSAFLLQVLRRRPVAIRRSPLDLPIAAFLATVLIGVERASSLDVALFGPDTRADGFFTLLAAVALFYIAYNLPDGVVSLRRAVGCLVLSATLVAGEGVAEALGHSVLGLSSPDQSVRASSLSGNPDFLGGILTLAWPLALGLAATSRGRARWLWTVSLILILAGLVASFTRGAWVGSAVALAVLVLSTRGSLRSLRRGLVATLAMLAFVAVILAAVVSIGPLAKLAGTMDGSQAGGAPASSQLDNLRRLPEVQRITTLGDGSGRLLIWQAALEVVRANPLLGAGYDNLYSSVTPYLSVEWARTFPDTSVDKAHNQYLDLAASLGLLGLSAYIWLIGAFALSHVRFIRRRASRTSRILLGAILAAWIGYLVHLFFLFDTVDSLAIFWILMGLACREITSQGPIRATSLRMPVVLAAPAGLLVTALACLLVYSTFVPVGAEYTRWKGLVADQLGQHSQAVQYYLAAAEMNPHSEVDQTQAASALSKLADGEQNQSDAQHLLDESVRLWNQAVLRDPDNAYLYAERGDAYSRYSNGARLRDALVDFRHAIDLYPNYYSAYAGVADAARYLGGYNEAVAAERKLLEVDPRNKLLLGNLAEDYAQSSRWADAISTWEDLSAVSGDSAGIRLDIAQAELAAGQKDKAVADLEKARALDPKNEQVDKLWQSLQDNGR